MVAFEDPKQFVAFLAKHRLSSDQFLFMYLIYRELYTELYTYTEQVKGLHPEEIQDLIRRGYLKNENVSNEYFADSFIVTEKFTSEIFKVAKEAALEFWNAYPPLLWVDGKRFSALAVDKEAFLEDYMEKIGFSRRLHSKVMKALNYGKELNAVNIRIDRWYKAKSWEQLEKEMNESQSQGERYGDKEF